MTAENKHNGWIKKYYVKTLDDLIGQEKIANELARRFKEDSLRQNILLSGQTGIGKTSIGSLIARTLNCKSPVFDKYNNYEFFSPCNTCISCQSILNEEDAVSFHFYDGSDLGIEHIRELKEICNRPSFFSDNKNDYKIIYIEEIQNIASGKDSSLQALLKLIEKDYHGKIYFIMSTMDINKINKAVVDRFHLHFKLQPVSVDKLIMLGGKILKEEKITECFDFNSISTAIDGLPLFMKEGLTTIAMGSNGSVRKFIGFLEACIYRELYSKEDILKNLYIINEQAIMPLIYKLLNLDKTFFKDIKTYDSTLSEFFYKSYAILSDILIYHMTGECKYPWQKQQFNNITDIDSVQELITCFKDIYENNSYFTNTYFYHMIYLYFDNKNIKLEEQKILPRRSR